MRRLAAVGLAAVLLTGCDDGRVRVACVGDSVTFGEGIPDRDRASYPAVLQARLGGRYVVGNFAAGGAGVLSVGDKPYVGLPHYRDALRFAPRVVVVMLGTNDTKPANWGRADGFEADLKTLVGAFQALETRPQVYLCTPPPAFPGRFGIDDGRLRDGVRPKVLAVGRELGLPVIDAYAALTGRPNCFPDGVHPNAAGAKVIADAVYDTLTAGDRPRARRHSPSPAASTTAGSGTGL